VAPEDQFSLSPDRADIPVICPFNTTKGIRQIAQFVLRISVP
jgi:hypothetical protein